MSKRTTWRSSAVGLFALLMIVGCSRKLAPPVAVETPAVLGSTAALPSIDETPVVPGETSPGELFYPLDVGNHWTSARTVIVRIVPDVGPPITIFEESSTLDTDHLGVVEHGGLEYVVERYTIHADGMDFISQALVRQDRQGLYEADVPLATDLVRLRGSARGDRYARNARRIAAIERGAAAGGVTPQSLRNAFERHDRLRDLASARGAGVAALGAPGGGAVPGELVALAYPLRPARTWHYREDPLAVYTVEGTDALELPAGRFVGWRMRVELPEFFAPGDLVHLWVGRQGYLRLSAHTETTLQDKDGDPYGRAVVDELHELAELDLVGSPRF